MTPEEIVRYSVVWNAILQTGWLIWSFSIHRRKHKEDD